MHTAFSFRRLCLTIRAEADPHVVSPRGTGFNTAASLLEEPRCTGDALQAVTADARLAAEVTALTHAFVLVLGVVTHGTLPLTRVVCRTQMERQGSREADTEDVVSELLFPLVVCFTQEEVRLVAAQTLVSSWSKAAMAAFVTVLTHAVPVHVRGQRAVTEPHTVSTGICGPVGATGEAGRRLMARTGQT